MNSSGGRMIPENEIQISVARSGGPGGQGVNTSESKVVLRWHVGSSAAFSSEEKDRIRRNASNRTGEDEIVIHCSENRTQLANKKACVDRLHAIVARANVQPKARVPTKMSRSRKARNLDSKTADKRKKETRRKVDND